MEHQGEHLQGIHPPLTHNSVRGIFAPRVSVPKEQHVTYRVDTEIPFGNVCDARVETTGPNVDVHFAADPHGGPESLWFCFRVVHTSADLPRRFRLVLNHSQNMLGASRPEALLPVVRMEGGDWERLPGGTPEMGADGRVRVVWETAPPNTSLDVAICYPYGSADLVSLVEDLGSAWSQDTIGVSQGGRPLQRISNAPGEDGATRPGVYLTARQHSGETPGSWVLEGVLRGLADAGDDAPLVWAVPLTNPDGIEAGDYGKDNFPYDLNRAWGRPPMRHETLVIQNDCRRWASRCQPVLCLDFHAPGASEADGCYFFLPNPDSSPEFHKAGEQWARTLAESMGTSYIAAPPGRVASYRSRWETPSFTQFSCQDLNVCGLTLEVPYGLSKHLVLTREAYADIGRRLAEGLIQVI